MKPNRRLVASVLYVVAVGVAASFALRGQRDSITDTISDVALSDLVLALALSTAALVASMLAWRELLAGFGHRVPVLAAGQTFFLSQVGKYLPGSVWPVVAQVEFGKAHGVPRKPNVWSFFIAMLVSLASGAVVGALALILAGTVLVPVAALAATLGVLVLYDRFGDTVASKVPLLERLRPEQWPDRSALTRAAGLFGAHWVLHGLQFAVVLRSLDVSIDALALQSIAAFSLAFVAGTLFIIAPAGLGVREGVLVALLGPLGVGVAAATAASLASRLVLTVADLVTAGFAVLVSLRTKRQQPDKPAPS